MAARSIARPLALALAAAALACGGDDLTLPNEGQPAEITIVRGNGQNGTIGQPVADSLVVRVVDRFGDPVSGVEVSWRAEDGGGVDPALSTTGADGRAATQRILGPQPGTYATVATATPLPEAPVVFTTTAVAATLSVVTQPSASAAAGVAFERQPVLQLLDQTSTPIARPGVVVTVQIATGGGSLGGVTSVASDPNGTVTFTNLSIGGSPGTRTLIFAADGFASATSGPIAVGVGAAVLIEAVEGGGQSATVNTTVPVAPAVVVRDAEGNGVPGVPVVFAVTGGGGSLTGATAATGADGIARVGSWRLGTAAGENTLRARVEGAELEGNPVTFAATGTAGAISASRSTIAAAPGTISASGGGSSSTITVTARDEFDNPVPGRTVTLAASGSNNAITQPDQPTNGDGVATGRLSATSVGPRTVSAQIDGSPIDATATVTVSGGPPSPGASSATVGNGTAGAATVISVKLKDQFGNPVAGQAGKISVAVTGANTLTAGPADDQGGGDYTVRYTPTVAGVDQVTIRVDGTSIAGSPFSSSVAPGAASPPNSIVDLPRTWRVFTNPGPIPVRVTVRDGLGNVRAGLTDQVEVFVDGSSTSLVVTNNGDGTYSASFPPPRFGKVPVSVTVNGASAGGGPFLVDITFF
ncbi:MAG TPA: Ig-like domain-containing protein [Gemmatimonadales bacterium]|nr:Ig-like domain-containing protein [Gemmatimonadales bacterium]